MTTEQVTTESMNRVIAEFMGLVVIAAGTKTMGEIKEPEISEAFLKYHSDWNQLKNVIDEIFKYSIAYPPAKLIKDVSIVVDIRAAHEWVYDWIIWYNSHK